MFLRGKEVNLICWKISLFMTNWLLNLMGNNMETLDPQLGLVEPNRLANNNTIYLLTIYLSLNHNDINK